MMGHRQVQRWTWRPLKAALWLAGAFTFAFLLGEGVHELGHYLAHWAYGNRTVWIVLDPFGSSRIVGVSQLPQNVMGVTSVAGPLLNLTLGIACSLVLWRRRRPALFPWLLWGPVAMVQEGVTFSLGLLTPGGDAAWIVASCMPAYIVLATGIGLLLAGITMTSWLLSSTVLARDDPFWRRLGIVLAGTSSLMLIRAIHAFIIAPALLKENGIPLLFALLLAFIVVLLHKPLTNLANTRTALANPTPITWLVAGTALLLGMSMFVFQVLALNVGVNYD
jgi:hypothetical protein